MDVCHRKYTPTLNTQPVQQQAQYGDHTGSFLQRGPLVVNNFIRSPLPLVNMMGFGSHIVRPMPIVVGAMNGIVPIHHQYMNMNLAVGMSAMANCFISGQPMAAFANQMLPRFSTSAANLTGCGLVAVANLPTTTSSTAVSQLQPSTVNCGPVQLAASSATDTSTHAATGSSVEHGHCMGVEGGKKRKLDDKYEISEKRHKGSDNLELSASQLEANCPKLQLTSVEEHCPNPDEQHNKCGTITKSLGGSDNFGGNYKSEELGVSQLKAKYLKPQLTRRYYGLYYCSYCGLYRTSDKYEMVRHLLKTSTNCNAYLPLCKVLLKDVQCVEELMENEKAHIPCDGTLNHGGFYKRMADFLELYQCNFCTLKFCDEESQVDHEKTIHKKKLAEIGCYQCSICQQNFIDEESKVEHERTIHKKNLVEMECYLCRFCQQNFIDEESKVEHERTIHKKKLTQIEGYQCSFCQQKFIDEEIKVDHEKTIHKRKLAKKDVGYRCNFCQRHFLDVESKVDHVKTIHKKKLTEIGDYQCNFCQQNFSDEVSRVDHEKIIHKKKLAKMARLQGFNLEPKHSSSSSLPLVCNLKSEEEMKTEVKQEVMSDEVCNLKIEVMFDDDERESHVVDHFQATLKCGNLKKEVEESSLGVVGEDSKEERDDDVKKDDDQSAVGCSELNETDIGKFIKVDRVGRLDISERSDANQGESASLMSNNEIVYSCEYCDFETNKKSELTAHNQELLHRINECPYKCGSKFLQLSQLFQHMLAIEMCLMKMGDEVFSCKFCDKYSCANEDEVKEHELNHHSSQTFECRYCPEKFSERDLLIDHMISHNIERFQCSICIEQSRVEYSGKGNGIEKGVNEEKLTTRLFVARDHLDEHYFLVHDIEISAEKKNAQVLDLIVL